MRNARGEAKKLRGVNDYDEGTMLNPERCYCTEATRYALTIEQTVLNQFGKGRNTRKKSEEWL